MEKKAIEHFLEHDLSPRSLSWLSEDRKAALSILCFAVSELHSLNRLYIFNTPAPKGDEPIKLAAAIQRQLLLRTWSAKLFEVEQFLKDLSGKKPQTKDEELFKFAKASLDRFESLNDADAYPFVRAIRNEMANHYSFAAAKKNLKHVPPHANFSFYMHDKNGNSFYPMGEEVMFSGRLNRFGANLDAGEMTKLVHNWMKWNLAANGWLASVHANFVEEFLFEDGRPMHVRKRSFWMPMELVGCREQRQTPLFVRTET